VSSKIAVDELQGLNSQIDVVVNFVLGCFPEFGVFKKEADKALLKLPHGLRALIQTGKPVHPLMVQVALQCTLQYDIERALISWPFDKFFKYDPAALKETAVSAMFVLREYFNSFKLNGTFVFSAKAPS
jgi:hypothetical protein